MPKRAAEVSCLFLQAAQGIGPLALNRDHLGLQAPCFIQAATSLAPRFPLRRIRALHLQEFLQKMDVPSASIPFQISSICFIPCPSFLQSRRLSCHPTAASPRFALRGSRTSSRAWTVRHALDGRPIERLAALLRGILQCKESFSIIRSLIRPGGKCARCTFQLTWKVRRIPNRTRSRCRCSE